MQIHRIDNQNFRGINTTDVTQAILYRLGTYERYTEFTKLSKTQNTNPLHVDFVLGKQKNIIGTISDADGNVLYTKKENVIRGLLNLSPIKFMSKLCKKADKINSGK